MWNFAPIMGFSQPSALFFYLSFQFVIFHYLVTVLNTSTFQVAILISYFITFSTA
jgi:hypothetical protein